jgi:hypothetical protein
MSLTELTKAFHHLETSNPPITKVDIRICNWMAELTLSPFCYFRFVFPYQFIDEEDYYSDVAAWRRIGRAIANNPDISKWKIDATDAVVGPAANCAPAFSNELKDNKSIEALDIKFIDQFLLLFDLAYFMQGNIQFKYLTLGSGSGRPVTPEQGNIIATGLQR